MKTWIVDADYPAMSMTEMVENVTRECARRLMNDEDYHEFCDRQDAFFAKLAAEASEYSRTHYFPGCYGDAMTDC